MGESDRGAQDAGAPQGGTDRDLLDLELPYRRRGQLREHRFESGMVMLRMILREGTRITQIDLDADSARAMGTAMTAWADAQGAAEDESGEQDQGAPSAGGRDQEEA